VTLRISLFRSELGMMIEMPSRELRRGNAARYRVEKTEDAVETVVGFGEDRAMHDFVQQHRAVEDRESGDKRKWQPEVPAIEMDDRRTGEDEGREIREGHQRMQPGTLRVEAAQILARKLSRELMFELLCVLCPVGHDQKSATAV